MSEFWGFSATPVTIDRDALVGVLTKLKVNDAILHYHDRWLHVIVPRLPDVRRFTDTVVEFFDHESAAWDFAVYVKGKRLGGGTFGTNAETGADDRGFDGDLAAVAGALGVDEAALAATFVPSSHGFLELTRLTLLPAGPGDVDAGSGIYFTDEEAPRAIVAKAKPTAKAKAKAKPTAKAKPKTKAKPKAKPKAKAAAKTKSRPSKSTSKPKSKSKSKR